MYFVTLRKDGVSYSLRLHEYDEAQGGGRLNKESTLEELQLGNLKIKYDEVHGFVPVSFDADGYSRERIMDGATYDASGRAAAAAQPQPGAGPAGGGSGAGLAGRTLLICEVQPDDEVIVYSKKFRSRAAFKDWLQRGGYPGILAEGCEAEGRTLLDADDWEELMDGARYVLPYSHSLASLDKALLQVRRQLGNQERGKEDEFGKAMLSDVAAHGLREARLCPQLRKIKDADGKQDLQEIDAVVMEEGTAHVGYRVADGTVQDVGEVTKCVLMIAARSQDPAKWPTYAPFHGKAIKGAFMYDSVAPKSSLEDVHQACRRNDITLYARNGRAISRVQAVAQSRHAPIISRGKIM